MNVKNSEEDVEMIKATDKLTTQALMALQVEAGEGGDDILAALCDRAIDGDKAAVAEIRSMLQTDDAAMAGEVQS